MSNLLLSVSEHLLGPGGLAIESLPAVLGELAGPGIDAADLYFHGQVSETWVLEDGIVKEGSFNLDQGVGVRAQSGEKTGFAYSNAITAEALSQAARAARSISRAGQHGRVQVFASPQVTALYAQDNPLDVLSRAEKVELLKRVDVAVYNAFKEGAEMATGINVLDLKSDGVGYAMDENNAALVTPEMTAAVEAAAAKIKSGELVVHDYMSDDTCPAATF